MTSLINFRSLSIYNRIRAFCQDFHHYIRIRNAKRIIIGAGWNTYTGWVSTNKEQLDVTSRGSFARYWKSNSRAAFLAEHVWEHLDVRDAECAAALCFEFLRSGGRLRIAVPDGFHPDHDYIESVSPGNKVRGTEDHKVLYTYITLRSLLKKTGFRVELLEYWDEHHTFHTIEWNSDDGHISRSRKNDPRNQEGKDIYTSIIADGIKP